MAKEKINIIQFIESDFEKKEKQRKSFYTDVRHGSTKKPKEGRKGNKD